MKKLLQALTAAILFLMPSEMFGQAPNLGSTADFVLFTGVGSITNGATPIYLTHLTGNVGSNSGAATGFGNIDGTFYSGGAVTVAATSDLTLLSTQLDTFTATSHPASATIGGGDTLRAGVYAYAGAATLTGTLYLDGQGNANAVFIFQIPGINTFDPAPNSKIVLINGAKACNVFWKSGGAIGSISAGTNAVLRGTFVSNGAINLYTGDTLEGRALSTIGAISVLGTGGIVAYTPIGCGSPVLTGPTAPFLGPDKYFAILTGNGAVTDDGTSHIIGDVGALVGSISGFTAAFVTGTIHTVGDAPTATAVGHLDTVYNYLDGLSYDIQLTSPSLFGHNLVLTPHTYLLGAATTLTDTLILNAEGDANAVFVFQVSGALNTTASSLVKLINGTQAKNVYWKVTGATTPATNSIFNGNVIGGGGAAAIDASATGSRINGRLLTTSGAITTHAATINPDVIDVAGPITGDSSVCVGATIPLAGADTGGVWSASNTYATVSTVGIVTGVSGGLDTIRYIKTNSFGSDTAKYFVTVKPLSVAGPITGPSNVCVGSFITIAGVDTGGTWSRSNSNATISSGGVVTGISAGLDTMTYITTNTCNSDTATKTITIIATPTASPIAGASVVCTGATTTLTDATAGGAWSATNGHATVLGGVVTGVTNGIDTIKYIVSNTCGADTAIKSITVNPAPNAGSISGPSTVCTGSFITLTDGAAGGTWSASNTHATVVAGVVTGVTSGLDTIRYSVTNSCGTAVATQIITVNPSPNAGTITGASSVCTGTSTTLTDTATGGTWSASNAHATVVAGVVTGITAGIDTIMYSVTNSCGTATAIKAVTVVTTPNAGVITGASSVCVGSTTTLTDASTGGAWTATNANASISGTGVVTGVTTGVDTIKYIVTTGCGDDTATKIITVNPMPNAGAITGASVVCTGTSITLIDAATGGTWSATNTHATVVAGIVTGVTAGIDTVIYTVTNGCGTDTATKAITIITTPNAGVIAGASSVCVGSTTTFTDAATGGAWTATNANASVSGTGVVTGVTAGMDTIRYIVTTGCGSDTATKIITINPLPNAGAITGFSSVCVGSSILLSDGASGGTWSATNTNATVAGGVVMGVTAGIDTIVYTVTNGCGTDTATKAIAVNPLPNAGSISGPASVCVSSSITVTDGASGGSWSASNGNATISTSGIVAGVTNGIDTIMYTVINVCGTDIATKAITINPLPNAGSISGASSVCVSSSITLTDGASGGTWSSSNTNATITSGGVVTGATAGIDTIMYSVSNVCGSASTTTVITINPLPNAGSISGATSVCVGSVVTLTDGASGGTWNAINAHATIVGGVVTGATAGTDTIIYIVSNICGNAITTKTIKVNALPLLTSVTNAVSICDSSTFSYIPTSDSASATFSWTGPLGTGIANSSTSGTGNINDAIFNITNSPQVITYIYTTSANGCSTVQGITDTVNPTPKMAGLLTATTCSGSPFVFTATSLVAGTTFTWTRAAVATIVPVTGSGTGDVHETLTNVTLSQATTVYAYTSSANGCSFKQNVTVTVYPIPSAPFITINAPTNACAGTMYQNFGTTTPLPGIQYHWSAINATIWATARNGQNALINFPNAGTATVILSTNVVSFPCKSTASYTVNVSSSVSSVPTVRYFEDHFVCTPSNEASYQWGYDDATTLDSTMLSGEINQDYLNTSPDFANKFYWVMTSFNGCNQKTYCNMPTAVENISAKAITMDVYPNPASDIINVAINTTGGDIQVEVMNMAGQKLTSVPVIDGKASINVANLAAGIYMVSGYKDGVRIGATRFIKN